MRQYPVYMDRQVTSALSFHTLFDRVPTQLMVMDRSLTIVYANDAYLRTTMRELSDIRGRYVFDAFPEAPERVALFRSAFERALGGEENVLTTEPFSIPVPGGGMKRVVWTCTHVPVADERGEIGFVMQNAVDVTAEYELDRHNDMLLRELNHRVKNSLASVQAIAHQSLVEGKSMREARDDLIARIHALASVQNLLLEENWTGADLRDALALALQPFGYEPENGAGGPIALDGPPVPLTPRQVQTISLAVHELATNAAKYGALSAPGGRIDIVWTHERQAGGAFTLDWRESGGPPVSPPARRGFGTVMLSGVLAREIGGTIALDYPESGAVCRMEGRLTDEDA